MVGVGGFLNNVSARDIQRRDRMWPPLESFDAFVPVGRSRP
jgi:2-keto-4-pentenoate hydratase/2-oxohepta-3-ene-1,7-dioic acid hydratase in catechol pathway